jgi:hypothetical protein
MNKDYDYPMKLAERDAMAFELNNRYADLQKLQEQYNELDREIESWEREQAVLDV